jgi:lysozyme family protein
MWKETIDIILKHEGGYVNDPKDAGGETNLGISKRSYPHLDILSLTKGQAEEIYWTDYWLRCQCNRLPKGLDLMVMDYAVNAGVSRASKALQGIVGAKQDGIIGAMTLDALGRHTGTPEGIRKTINEYYSLRQAHYESLDTFSIYGKGWSRRNTETLNEALKWIL